MNITIINKQTDYPIPEKQLIAIVHEVLAFQQEKAEELTIYFVDTKEISDLHNKYFNDPTPTDCISFPMDEPKEHYRVLGDLFVCPKTAINYANEHHSSPFSEIVLYVIHGILHLIGYDDLEEEERKAMQKQEAMQMENLKSLGLLKERRQS